MNIHCSIVYNNNAQNWKQMKYWEIGGNMKILLQNNMQWLERWSLRLTWKLLRYIEERKTSCKIVLQYAHSNVTLKSIWMCKVIYINTYVSKENIYQNIDISGDRSGVIRQVKGFLIFSVCIFVLINCSYSDFSWFEVSCFLLAFCVLCPQKKNSFPNPNF